LWGDILEEKKANGRGVAILDEKLVQVAGEERRMFSGKNVRTGGDPTS